MNQRKAETAPGHDSQRAVSLFKEASDAAFGSRVATCQERCPGHEHHSKPSPRLSNTKLTKKLTKLTILVKPVVFLSV
jgi:hypothetical protein